MDDLEQRPKTRIQWLLGNYCNYQCSYCHEMFRMGDKPFPNQGMIKDVCLDIVHHYDELGRDVVFEFIGGEPTLAGDVSELGKRLHNHPVDFVLKTNGSADLDWWIKSRKYVSNVVISLHKEFVDLDHIEEVIKILQDETLGYPAQIELLIPTTSQSESWEWAIETRKRFRKKFDLGELQLLYTNFGRGSNQYYPYTESQWSEYSRLTGLSNPVQRTETTVLEKTPSMAVSVFKEIPVFKGRRCYAGVETLVIDNSGDVWRGWCRFGGKIGNIYDTIEWPRDPIICTLENCSNGFDRTAKKEDI